MTNYLQDTLTLIIKVLIVGAFIIFEVNPEYYGERLARMDVAYDSIWGEYIMDCDCTEPL
jgi:hypothetical protein